jgi:hypothetical protein
MRGPADAHNFRMCHTLVAAPEFLVTSTIGPSATVLLYTLLFIQRLPSVRCHMIERIRFSRGVTDVGYGCRAFRRELRASKQPPGAVFIMCSITACADLGFCLDSKISRIAI